MLSHEDNLTAERINYHINETARIDHMQIGSLKATVAASPELQAFIRNKIEKLEARIIEAKNLLPQEEV